MTFPPNEHAAKNPPSFLVALSADPLLVWNYGVMGVLALMAGAIFWWSVTDLDAKEDELNNLATGHVGIYDVNEKR